MGGSYDSRSYATHDRKEVEKAWADDHSDSRREDGASYSGCIGVMPAKIARWHDLKLKSREAADDWLVEHHDKWEPAEAVSHYLPEEPTPADKTRTEAASKAEREAQAAQVGTYNEVLVELRTGGRGGFVTCGRCDSKLARARLKGTECPLCPNEDRWVKHGQSIPEGFTLIESGEEGGRHATQPGSSLLTKAQEARIDKAKAATAKAMAALSEAQKPRSSKALGWTVGGWCSS